MLNKTGAGAQHPIRSHWMLRPSPQSYNNSKQQSKRYIAQGKHNNSEQQQRVALLVLCIIMCDARRPREGGGVGCTSGRPALSRGARVFPRGAPGVAATSGRSGGWRCPGCARHPGTSQGGVNPEVRPKKEKMFRFYDFWSFLANFCLLC